MNKTVIFVIALVVVACAAFYGGTMYAKAQAPQRGSGQFAAAGGGAFAGRTGGTGRAGGGFTAGQVVSVQDGSLTIEEQNGSSTEIVLTSPSTQILKTVSGSLNDLTAGAQVVVTGTSNSDGSLTAQSIQIRPAGSANAPIIRAGASAQ